jgi:hypothetical protein
MASVESTDNERYPCREESRHLIQAFQLNLLVTRGDRISYDDWYVLNEIVRQKISSQYGVRIRALLWTLCCRVHRVRSEQRSINRMVRNRSIDSIQQQRAWR